MLNLFQDPWCRCDGRALRKIWMLKQVQHDNNQKKAGIKIPAFLI
jgi:hypothetical protein